MFKFGKNNRKQYNTVSQHESDDFGWDQEPTDLDIEEERPTFKQVKRLSLNGKKKSAGIERQGPAPDTSFLSGNPWGQSCTTQPAPPGQSTNNDLLIDFGDIAARHSPTPSKERAAAPALIPAPAPAPAVSASTKKALFSFKTAKLSAHDAEKTFEWEATDNSLGSFEDWDAPEKQPSKNAQRMAELEAALVDVTDKVVKTVTKGQEKGKQLFNGLLNRDQDRSVDDDDEWAALRDNRVPQLRNNKSLLDSSRSKQSGASAFVSKVFSKNRSASPRTVEAGSLLG